MNQENIVPIRNGYVERSCFDHLEKNDEKGRTALIIAVEDNNYALAKFLCGGYADINAKNSKGETPLMISLNNDNYEIAKLLLNPAYTTAKETRQLFNLAVRSGNIERIKFLMKFVDINGKDENGDNALCYTQNKEVAKLLIDSGVRINSRNLQGSTALQRASEYLPMEVFEVLLEYGSDPKIIDDHSRTLLMHASARKIENNTIIDRALGFGINLEAKDINGDTALLYAVVSENIGGIQKLCKYGINIENIGNKGQTPLMYAAEKLKLKSVKELIRQGANVNFKSSNGEAIITNTIFHNGNYDIIKELVESGADIEARTKSRLTPLMIALSQGHNDIAKYLVDKGAKLDVKDNTGSTLLMYAITSTIPNEYWIPRMKNLSRKYINQRSSFGITALMISAKYHKLINPCRCIRYCGCRSSDSDRDKMVEWLILDQNADVDIKDPQGRTALSYAFSNYNYHFADILLKKKPI